MRKNIRMGLALCLFILLITSSYPIAAEKTNTEKTKMVIKGVGTFNLPYMQVLPLQSPAGGVGNTLIAVDKEQNVVRSINLFFLDLDFSRIQILRDPAPFNDMLTEMAKVFYKGPTTPNLLFIEPLDSLELNNQQNSIKQAISLMQGYVIHINFYLINGTDGLVLLVAQCPIGDSNYWKPFLSTMLSNIKR